MLASALRDHSAATARLLRHYDANARALPWRRPPGARQAIDPYHVWLSEVMLQQTTVATVIPRFQRFVARWPTVEALAEASDEQVLAEWAGLGYYARARNLIACARAVAAMGGFPDTEAALRRLPGVGDYTAAAIAAIAFGQAVAVIDTNVERVIARLIGLAGTVAESRAEIRETVAAMVPADRPGDFAQATMDLGATLCRPRAPNCAACPLAGDCRAWASGTPGAFPAPKARRERPRRHGQAWWIERDGAIWLVRRPPSGMLGAMAALPGPDWADAPLAGPPPLARVAWTFSHFTLDLAIVELASPPVGDGWWQPLDALDEAGLPSLYRHAAEAVLAARTAVSPGSALAA